LEGYLSRLILVRHGETELKSSERFWGRTDVTLSALGLRQAEQLRDCLAAEKINAAYSSNLRRAWLTAKTIASRHKLEVITCPELREIDFGQLEGMTFDHVRRLYPEISRLWMERSPELKYPGGESLHQLDNRVSDFRQRLEKHANEETILIVAHSGVLRTLACQLLDKEAQHRWQIRLDLASLTVIETNPQGAILTLLNDVSHLR